MSVTVRPSSWVISRQRIAQEVYWLPVVWAVFAALVALMTAIFATLATTVAMSGWETASTLPRWYMGGVGFYLSAVFLPLYVAHGFTRREYMSQILVYMVVLVTALAVLMTAGYVIEAGIYRWLGWTQALTGGHLFTSPLEYHLVLTEFWIIFLVWLAAGALLGAAFYRNGVFGVLMIPVVLAILALAESVSGTGAIGVVFAGTLLGEPSVPGAVAMCLALAVLTVAGTWAIVRDMPVRSKGG